MAVISGSKWERDRKSEILKARLADHELPKQVREKRGGEIKQDPGTLLAGWEKRGEGSKQEEDEKKN